MIITGAAGEIGFAAAKHFAKAGANVMLVDIDKKALQQRAGELDSPKIAFSPQTSQRKATFRGTSKLPNRHSDRSIYFSTTRESRAKWPR
ncbi:SDR family NAD(P)-dependent oxidoreductase [bacterium]|nr:SDR family NAD(P)-dependent oxidoreductase [bacterium]